MKILKISSLRGPNYWSNYRKKLIVLRLDLEQYEYLPTNQLAGFNERLKNLIPTLYTHRCSPGFEGGFYQRLEEGTWLGHVIEHVALELQCLAGIDCGFGRTYSTEEEGVYDVIFSYEIESAGIYAAKAAVNIVDTLAQARDYTSLNTDLAELSALFNEQKLGPSTQSIVTEALKRKIPVRYQKDSPLIVLGQGCNQKKIWATVSSQTSSIAVDIAANKELTKQILDSSLIPVPKGLTIQSIDELDKAIDELGFPMVIKPKYGNHGRGITTNIKSKEKLILGFNFAKRISDDVIVERFIKGCDYRFLVINYKVVAVAKRTPAMVIGTGTQSIQDLINQVNQDPKRGEAHDNLLTTIDIDEITLNILKDNNLSLESILPKGQILYLKETANLSSGGSATDVTHTVHPANIFLAERIARLVDLDICGIDIMAENITIPINKKNGAVLEVNAGPGFRMHLSPCYGKPQNVAAPLLDMLYPHDSAAKIPTVAVTGTNGKTTVVRLIAKLAKNANHYVGFTTTDGVYLDDKLIYQGDCSGPASAETIFQEPQVDFAVLECARGGILRAGLGFDDCDLSIITNITGDHLGLNDIYTLEELARVKAVVAHSTKKEGYAILNADDDLVYALKEELTCNIALFSLQENSRIRTHCHLGGLAAYIDDESIVIQKGSDKYNLAKIGDIPITFQGTATSMIQNVLPAALAGFISNFPLELIETSFHNFYPTVDNIPGRMNLFKFEHCRLMIDYAHNEGAFIELKKFLNTVQCNKKIGVIAAVGDRRDEDIEKIGYLSAQMFDEIVIRHDEDGRGRTNEQLTDLLMRGIKLFKLHPNVKIISDELDALRYALDQSIPDTFIFYSIENVFKIIDYLKKEDRKVKLTNLNRVSAL